MTPRWINYFMEMAHHAASISKDPSTKVGAVAVDAQRNIVATGFNGLPRGLTDDPARMQRPEKYRWTAHAEENLVATVAYAGRSLAGATVFVTHYPCATCARLLIQSGVAKLFVGDGKTSMQVEEFEIAGTMFSEAGVDVTQCVRLTIDLKDALTEEWK
jgi:dCMP deaminase